MKATAILSYLFVCGFCLGLWSLHRTSPLDLPAYQPTFNDRAGHMFDGVDYDGKPIKSDRLPGPAYPDLMGGVLSGNSTAVKTLTFRPLQQSR
jgi:hypothetical protein